MHLPWSYRDYFRIFCAEEAYRPSVVTCDAASNILTGRLIGPNFSVVAGVRARVQKPVEVSDKVRGVVVMDERAPFGQMQHRQPPSQRPLDSRPGKLPAWVVYYKKPKPHCRAKALVALTDLLLRTIFFDVIDQLALRRNQLWRHGPDQV